MSQTLVSREAPATTSVGLPVSWYFDPDILEVERRELFATGPTYAGHVSLVPQEGNYLALGGQQAGKLLVQHDGRPRLISNVCRHRQALMLTGSGRVKNIVCPIHHWTYDLDGRQIAAPHFPEYPCLDLEQTELTEWNGLLFAGPRDVREELAPLAAWTELSARDYVLARVDEEEQDINWKTFLEIYLEDYHIGVVHPGFRAFIDADDLRGSVQWVGGERFFCEQANVRWPPPAVAGSTLFAEFQRILMDVLGGRRPPFAAIWLCLFPGQLVEWYPFSQIITTYMPLSPTRTRIRSECYFDRQIAEKRPDYVQAGLAVLDEVSQEDQAAAEAFHRGRQALFDEQRDDPAGPYQEPMEQGLRRIHDFLRQAITGRWSDSTRE